MKCPVCYIARFPLLAGMVACCLVWITYDAFAAFVSMLLKEMDDLYDEVCRAATKALRGESFV